MVEPRGGRGAYAPPPPQILGDQIALSRLRGANYAPHITTRHPRFSELAPSLQDIYYILNSAHDPQNMTFLVGNDVYLMKNQSRIVSFYNQS